HGGSGPLLVVRRGPVHLGGGGVVAGGAAAVAGIQGHAEAAVTGLRADPDLLPVSLLLPGGFGGQRKPDGIAGVAGELLVDGAGTAVGGHGVAEDKTMAGLGDRWSGSEPGDGSPRSGGGKARAGSGADGTGDGLRGDR